MKKLFLASVIIATALCANAQQKYHADPVFDAGRIKTLQDASPNKAAAEVQKPRKVLLFSKTAGFRHYDGIVAAKEVLSHIGNKLGIWELVMSEDPKEFEAVNLRKYDAVILCHTTADFLGENSDVLTQNLMEFVKNGGGVFAIHAGVDCYNYDKFRNKPFTDMLGGEFISHPWYTSNAPQTMVIDDMKSPITKGIWEEEGFRISDEIYQVGKSYDRSKCRVLIRLDLRQSPVTNEDARKAKIRDDGDLALVWIKDYGKGRVAYGGFGHGWENYRNPKIQELYMRLMQFVCGDLKADTTSIPFTDKTVYISMYKKPSIEQIKELSELKYGEKDKEINKLIFATCASNTDEAFNKEMQNFIFSEISQKKGTVLYRELLAELLWPIGTGSFEGKFEKLAKKETETGIRSRLENAVAHSKNKGKMPLKKEKEIAIASELPTNRAQLIKLITFLGKNPDVNMPSYLTFEALDENAKAHLIYALGNRQADLKPALSLKPQSSEMTIALAFAAAKVGTEKDLANIIFGADFLDNNNMQIAASYLASIKSDKVVETLMNMLQNAKGKQSQLIIETVTKFDLDPMVAKIFDGFANKSTDQKLAAMKAAESIANKEVFIATMNNFVAENDKKVKSAMVKTMRKCAVNGFDSNMFASVENAYQKSDKTQKPVILSFAQFDGGDKAIELCKEAYKQGLREESIKTLGDWRNQSALEPLLAIAKVAKDERTKTLTQMSMVKVGERAGLSPESAVYLLKNAVRAEEKDKVAEIAVKYPSPQVIEALDAAGFKDQANKARENLKKVKTTYSYFNGTSDFKAITDKNLGTRWSSNVPMKKGQWFAIDFGYPKKISKLTFQLASSKNDFPNKIEVFADGRKVDAKFNYTGNVATIDFSPAINAMVIKVVIAEDKTSYWWSIHQLEIQ